MTLTTTQKYAVVVSAAALLLVLVLAVTADSPAREQLAEAHAAIHAPAVPAVRAEHFRPILEAGDMPKDAEAAIKEMERAGASQAEIDALRQALEAGR